ncbi:MAG: hypothetical protein WC732_09010 [Candidatus Omnitrophota bacterium]
MVIMQMHVDRREIKIRHVLCHCLCTGCTTREWWASSGKTGTDLATDMCVGCALPCVLDAPTRHALLCRRDGGADEMCEPAPMRIASAPKSRSGPCNASAICVSCRALVPRGEAVPVICRMFHIAPTTPLGMVCDVPRTGMDTLPARFRVLGVAWVKYWWAASESKYEYDPPWTILPRAELHAWLKSLEFTGVVAGRDPPEWDDDVESIPPPPSEI